jgi:hypothetical protein
VAHRRPTGRLQPKASAAVSRYHRRVRRRDPGRYVSKPAAREIAAEGVPRILQHAHGRNS